MNSLKKKYISTYAIPLIIIKIDIITLDIIITFQNVLAIVTSRVVSNHVIVVT